jgi:hypothetical protein
MTLPRVRLSGILIVVAVVASVLGALQVRRNNLKRELAELTGKNGVYKFNDDWLWPTPPESVGIAFRYEGRNRVLLDSKAYTPTQAVEQFHAMEANLRDFGVKRVWMHRLGLESWN